MRLLVLILAVLGLAGVPAGTPSASASCAAPRLSIPDSRAGHDHPVLVLGSSVTVVGRGFVTGCDDTESASGVFGCSAGRPATEAPRRAVPLVVVVRGPRRVRLPVGESDAGTDAGTGTATGAGTGVESRSRPGRLGVVVWRFTVPASLPSGPATLEAAGAEPLKVTLVPQVSTELR